jgi:predicted RNase H-like nuclease (RuvC/YqgF family)
LLEEVENLNSEVDHLTETNNTLQSSLAEKKNENEQLEESLANQRREMSTAADERNAQSDKSSMLLGKQTEDRLRSDLHDIEQDREVLKKLLEKQEHAHKELFAKYQKAELEVLIP